MYTSAFPTLTNLTEGVEVPTPTSPDAVMTNGDASGDVESSTIKEGPEPVLVTESFAYGLVVPIPTSPAELILMISVPVIEPVGVERNARCEP